MMKEIDKKTSACKKKKNGICNEFKKISIKARRLRCQQIYRKSIAGRLRCHIYKQETKAAKDPTTFLK